MLCTILYLAEHQPHSIHLYISPWANTKYCHTYLMAAQTASCSKQVHGDLQVKWDRQHIADLRMEILERVDQCLDELHRWLLWVDWNCIVCVHDVRNLDHQTPANRPFRVSRQLISEHNHKGNHSVTECSGSSNAMVVLKQTSQHSYLVEYVSGQATHAHLPLSPSSI